MKSFALWKWIDALVVALSVSMIFLFFAVVSVSAHANLAESTPRNGEQVSTSPKEVVATFTEELETDGSTMRVFDENGRQVDNGNGGVDLFDPDHKTMIVTLPANLPKGKYTVEWVSLSLEDGDEVDGAFAFGVATDVEAAVAVNQTDTFAQSNGVVGWWVSGGIIGLIAFLLVAMLLLTRQPMTKFE